MSAHLMLLALKLHAPDDVDLNRGQVDAQRGFPAFVVAEPATSGKSKKIGDLACAFPRLGPFSFGNRLHDRVISLPAVLCPSAGLRVDFYPVRNFDKLD